jgi:UDPglucose 6-dehydrogenase
MRLGIVGGGTVGHATARAYFGHVEEVRVYDVVDERRTHSLDETLDCGLVMVCLPTPQKEGSLECDTSAVDNFFRVRHGAHRRDVNWVLRSTVPVGTTRRLRERYDLPNLVHSPEFLSARTAALDAQMPARNVIGSERGLASCGPETAVTANPVALHNLYARRFPGVPIHHMTSDESEAVKLFQNAFSAVKIACFNEFHAFASRLGLDWPRVREALLAGGWISPAHTQVPGPDGKFGFGGACLPKDLASFVHQMEQTTVWEQYPFVANAALQRNKLDRERNA